MNELSNISPRQVGRAGFERLPAIITRAGESAAWRFIEFFTATIRNRNTRAAYAQAVTQFFEWCTSKRIQALEEIRPTTVAAYIEQLTAARSAPTVKQHLAGIRMLFDWLVTGHVMATNPAHAVRGPKHSTKRGKTPVLSSEEARQLLDSIKTDSVVGLRDRALVALMAYTFARVSAAVGMDVGDYYPQQRRWWIRLKEKGGKHHTMPAHHNLELYLAEYIEAAGIRDQRKSPLFRSVDRRRKLTLRPMSRNDVLRMVKRRAIAAGLPYSTCCHTFRATGITAYLKNGGKLEIAQQMAAHESARTTGLYDRRGDEISLDEVERVGI